MTLAALRNPNIAMDARVECTREYGWARVLATPVTAIVVFVDFDLVDILAMLLILVLPIKGLANLLNRLARSRSNKTGTSI